MHAAGGASLIRRDVPLSVPAAAGQQPSMIASGDGCADGSVEVGGSPDGSEEADGAPSLASKTKPKAKGKPGAKKSGGKKKKSVWKKAGSSKKQGGKPASRGAKGGKKVVLKPGGKCVLNGHLVSQVHLSAFPGSKSKTVLMNVLAKGGGGVAKAECKQASGGFKCTGGQTLRCKSGSCDISGCKFKRAR
mmetsp:Transcript_22553/g.51979  ORF Transcript_22553/g.51979 Transcript_22553/m.51979 type:complete len:190 (-) Transcript_22553:149-718(-)